MKLTLHHINLSTDDVPRMQDFYRDILRLVPETTGLPVLEKTRGYAEMWPLSPMARSRRIWRPVACHIPTGATRR
jgi:catechol 2,3-dioxygenase-like lactoylglutathione lyase family enzyme